MLYDGAGSSCIPKLQLKQTNRKASRLQLLLIKTNAQDALIDTISVPELTKLNSVKLVKFSFFFFEKLVFLLTICGALSSTVVVLGTCKTSQHLLLVNLNRCQKKDSRFQLRGL